MGSFPWLFTFFKSNQALYTDTDSIIVYNVITDDMVSDRELGKLWKELDFLVAAMVTARTYALKNIDEKYKVAASAIQKGLVKFHDVLNAALGDFNAL